MGHIISKQGAAVPVALTSDDLAEFLKADKAGDAISTSNLLRAGKIFVADDGAQVKVLAAVESGKAVRVLILTGRHALEEGWVSADAILAN